MNEISFRDFNKSILNNGSLNNFASPLTDAPQPTTNAASTRKIETTRTLNESASKTSGAAARAQHSNTSVVSSGHNRSMKQQTTTTTTGGDVAKVPFKPAGINSTRTFRRTVAENNLIPYEIEKDTLYSTWTPLSDETTNSRVFLSIFVLFLFYIRF